MRLRIRLKLIPLRSGPFLAGTHVTGDSGTSLVHTAPSHGVDDFEICQQYKLIDNEEFVDDAGQFTARAGPELVGLSVRR